MIKCVPNAKYHVHPLKESITSCMLYNTVKPVLSGHSEIDKMKVLKTNGRSLMKVESIANALLEHSAILLTCVKQYSVLKTNFWSSFLVVA